MFSAKQFKQLVRGEKRGLAATCLRGLLWLAEGIYVLGVRYRNWQFDTALRKITKVEVPVISVGNITLGGTGKTPLVAYLSRWFRQQDIRVSIISRGYKAEEGSQNDEAKELEQLLPDVPHLQNPDRVAAAQVAIEELATQLIVLDDALQHRQIHRDLNIVLVDATEPFGLEHVFPRGTLREPLAGLARADLLIITRSDMVSSNDAAVIKNRLKQYHAEAPILTLQHQPARLIQFEGSSDPIEAWQGKKVAAFCAIGNPSGFRHTLQQCQLNIVAFKEFDDHHPFNKADIESLTTWADSQPQIDAVICTHKDLVKICVDKLGKIPLFALTIEASFSKEDEEQLSQTLKQLLPLIPADTLKSI